jgi:uncharacterized protein involved in propanediol utilization
LSAPAEGEAPPPRVVADWLREARAAIDATFGEGHAARHPELVAAFLQAAAIESAAASGRAATRDALHLAARISRETNETILKLKPRLFG